MLVPPIILFTLGELNETVLSLHPIDSNLTKTYRDRDDGDDAYFYNRESVREKK